MIRVAPNGALSWEPSAGKANLSDNILLSLWVPLGRFWQNPSFGSELHLLRRDVLSESTPARAKAMTQRALKWMVTSGRLTSLSVNSEQRSSGLWILIRAIGRGGIDVALETFVPVGVVS